MKKQEHIRKKQRNKSMDPILLIVTLVLLFLGLVAVLSASAPYALNMYNDSYHFFKSQALYGIIGIGVMLFVSKIDYRRYKKLAKIALIGGILLIGAVFIPGLGVTRNDATRWLRLGFQFQPSEITKIAVIVFYSAILSQEKWRKFLTQTLLGLFLSVVPLIFIVGILYFQPHMSAAMIILILYFVIMFAAGLKWGFIGLGAGLGLVGAVLMILAAPYRLARVTSWIDPWKDLQGDGWQLAQSLMAVGSGGLFGRGLGKSIQKYMYLPEQYNDFIFAVWCEEIGFVGAILILLLFAIFVWRGITIALNCKDRFGSFMALGITTMIGIQAIFNIAVVTGTMPVTGMSLPFFSYGGTSLLILLASTGILLNISRNCEK